MPMTTDVHGTKVHVIRLLGWTLEILKYLHENGCRWDEYTCRQAAQNGELEALNMHTKMAVLGRRTPALLQDMVISMSSNMPMNMAALGMRKPAAKLQQLAV
ncbi:expressed unknown protein [Seminavis robusta]|uniref:Uncharacterized protein n=1 Tax=Seminavis robusta TaxID=568900 RepID=A0A9N8DNQ3_9STRA|nr:expressed unknown protein [Seminavis robusta]|eukprot:Sro184_g080060.1 n/a (102) ;mRNA; f:77350-77655